MSSPDAGRQNLNMGRSIDQPSIGRRIAPLIVFYSIVSVLAIFLFSRQVAFSDPERWSYYSDTPEHLSLIPAHISRVIYLPAPAFHIAVVGSAAILQTPIKNAAVVVLTLSALALVAMTHAIVARSLPHWPSGLHLLLTALTLLVGAIYVPPFNPFYYLGQGTPNVWHSPTLLLVMPLALIISWWYSASLRSSNNPANRWTTTLVSAFLALSVFIKPNFALVFIPASALFVPLVAGRAFWRSIPRWLAIVLPAVGVLSWQFLNTYTVAGQGFQLSPNLTTVDFFSVWARYSPFVPLSIVLATAFPLALFIVRFGQLWSNRRLMFSWVLLVVGMFEFGLLSEAGTRANDFNWMWGYLIALHLLFLFSLVEFARWMRVGPPLSSFSSIMKASIVFFFLFLHLLSGLYYTLMILFGVDPVFI